MNQKNRRNFLLFAVILLAPVISFAQTEREKGIENYQNGNYAEAVRLLNLASKQPSGKTDAEIWNYIGLAQINQKKIKDARKALETAVKLSPQNSAYRTNLAYALVLEGKPDEAQSEIKKVIVSNPASAAAFYIRGMANLWEKKNERAITDAQQAIALDSNFTAAYILHSDALLASFGDKWGKSENEAPDDFTLLARAAESLNNCLTNCPKDDSLKTVAERVDTIKAFANYFERKNAPKDAPPDDSSENKIPLKILFKPTPKYTDEAREAHQTGNVRLAIFFGADGETKYIIPLQGLRYGLTEQTIKAARGITFEPEKIDGKPVSVVKVMVFNYSIY